MSSAPAAKRRKRNADFGQPTAPRHPQVPRGVPDAGEAVPPASAVIPRTTVDVCHNILSSLNNIDSITQRRRCAGETPPEHNANARTTTNTTVPLELEKDGPVGDQCDMLDLQCIISHVPYKNMLQDLFSADQDSGNTHAYMMMASDSCVDAVHPSTSACKVPLLCKAYEETFMREHMYASERACSMGAQCECNFIDPVNKFTGVELLLPDQPIPEMVGMCVLCHRKNVQILYYDMIYSGVGHHALIQKYGNICGVDDEYARQLMLICPPEGPLHCMPLPIMSHQRNRYSVAKIGNVRHIVQHNVLHQDFQ
jgi:hypothetical protein